MNAPAAATSRGKATATFAGGPASRPSQRLSSDGTQQSRFASIRSRNHVAW
jgi:hypothetical protein